MQRSLMKQKSAKAAMLSAAIGLSFIPVNVYAQEYTASGTWTKPAGSGFVQVECWGAGGGGGRGSNKGCGGGGGGYIRKVLALSSLGATETVTIGTGGAGATSSASGAVGGNSSFGSFLTAYGGAGGGFNNGGAGSCLGGGGGGWLSAASGATPGNPLMPLFMPDGTTITYFGEGGTGVVSGAPALGGYPGVFHGGGGGGANSYVNSYEVGGSSVYGGGGGASAMGTVRAGGYSAYGGNGGASAASSTAGGAGSLPGGGGAGADDANGGNGAGGMCRVIVVGGGGGGDNLGNHTATQNLGMGGFDVTNAGGYFHGSDKTLKTDIKAVSGLDILKHITGVSFNWKKDGHASMGVIAQEMEKVMPSAVFTDPKTGIKSVEYDQLVAPTIEAIKELDAKNTALEEDMRALREEMRELKGQR